MSTTIPHHLITNPELMDIVDEKWAREKLEDSGEQLFKFCFATPLCCMFGSCAELITQLISKTADRYVFVTCLLKPEKLPTS